MVALQSDHNIRCDAFALECRIGKGTFDAMGSVDADKIHFDCNLIVDLYAYPIKKARFRYLRVSESQDWLFLRFRKIPIWS